MKPSEISVDHVESLEKKTETMPSPGFKQFIEREIFPVVVHELGHFLMAKILLLGSENFLIIEFGVGEERAFNEELQDQDWVRTISFEHSRIKTKTKDATPPDDKTSKLISAAGLAAERLLDVKLPVKYPSETDLDFFADTEEAEVYITQAKELLAPHRETLNSGASKLAAHLSGLGPGEYEFNQTELEAFIS